MGHLTGDQTLHIFVQASLVFRVLSPSSRGLGHCPFTAVTRVRLPLGTPFHQITQLFPAKLQQAVITLSCGKPKPISTKSAIVQYSL